MTGRELLGGPPLVEDIELDPPTHAPVAGAHHSCVDVASDEKSEDAEITEHSGLRIEVRYSADAVGRFANYSFDGKLFAVKLTAQTDRLTPEELSDMGEEMQRAAVSMIK